MARRRSHRPWWKAYADRGLEYGLPFDFVHARYLTELGVAREDDDLGLVVDSEGLRDYRPPDDATDQLLLTCPASGRVVRRSERGTRMDPVAASWLWEQRALMEKWRRGAVLSAQAWCTHCGRHFVDHRARRRAARWCSSCRRSRKRHLPALRSAPRWTAMSGSRQNGLITSTTRRLARLLSTAAEHD